MILVNGNVQDTVSALDRGLAYGDGLFETIAVRDSNPQLLDLHWQRLERGCARLKIPFPGISRLMDDIERLLEHARQAQKPSGIIKVIVTRGAGGRGYRFEPDMNVTRIAILSDWPSWQGTERDTGVKCKICETQLSSQPVLAGIKHLNRLEQVMARAEWSGNDIAEGIMLDAHDHIIEGTMSNIFFIDRQQTIVTPALDQCGVAGVQRENILSIADNAGFKIDVTDVNLTDLEKYSEAFISNSLIGIWPVTGIDKHDYQIGPATRALQEKLFKS
ncbi:MAG: aminodeoxychorismate lyase [Gammaproteobacteria bacterium]|nr:aminodeoxychorismate lyase [Gammaproteobacteria bacterium]